MDNIAPYRRSQSSADYTTVVLLGQTGDLGTRVARFLGGRRDRGYEKK